MATPAMNDTTEGAWERIEREAREQVQAETERMEFVPPEFGESVAWADCRFARTESLSLVHRVGVPQHDAPYTTCGEPIPPRRRWLALSPGFIRSLGRCRYCEAEAMKLSREIAA